MIKIVNPLLHMKIKCLKHFWLYIIRKLQNYNFKYQNFKCKLQNYICKYQIYNCKYQNFNCKLQNYNCKYKNYKCTNVTDLIDEGTADCDVGLHFCQTVLKIKKNDFFLKQNCHFEVIE